MDYASRAGDKLAHALQEFHIDVSGLVCADLGCSAGGFSDCLLQNGAAKIYSVDTGYGVLAWRLRQDPKVTVLERTNALHVTLPELVDFVSIDVSWTPQRLIFPKAITLLKPIGNIVSLVKPHYEAKKAHVSLDEAKIVLQNTITQLQSLGINIKASVLSPITGQKGGNPEFLICYTQGV
jgi:23S rRNA (cytidine1920-2'-O)/16S rRNA (cytidine1409-2'-O)-methyltransferase